MKKLDLRRRRWLRTRASNQFRRRRDKRVPISGVKTGPHEVELWTAEGIKKAFSLRPATMPPACLCFDQNADDTLEFFENLRRRSPLLAGSKKTGDDAWYVKRRYGDPSKGELRRILGYIDFSGISYLSTAAAVVLTADYMRLAKLGASVPPAVNIDEWSTPVFRKLFEIGFFSVVGMTEEMGAYYSERDGGRIRVLPIMTGTNAAELGEIAERLQDMPRFIQEGSNGLSEDVELALNSALGEAMINVAEHAYSEGYRFLYKHVGRWWVTAEANRENHTITVIIYDQGATIPVTLPRRMLWHSIRQYATQMLGLPDGPEFKLDGAYIEGAMRLGTSSTGENNRGYGLPQMKDVVDVCGAGSIKVFSRGGMCKYDSSGYTNFSYPNSIGGTLIEWTIELPGASSA
ncbi:ATP-binding protein [Paracoccus sp. Arc7-R13]|uniref:ATP-binding protein n=1 Tax=Paracoccus sp. Arc7-R13 TaxID=2500532 RepID=UPI0013E2F4F5|nr:ATP-binding protein [Paracoccus sp. Arc7-R13]